MIFCKELNKNFDNKADLFKALRECHKDIIADKAAKIYNTKEGDNKGGIDVMFLDAEKLKEQTKGLVIDDNYYYIAVNTTKILDSHQDLHVNSVWNKTTKEQQGKVYLVWDHEFKGSQTIVRKEHIEMFVAEIPFSLLKMPYEGNTEALIYKFRKDKVIDQKAKDWLESGDDIQASVRMMYIKILFALNSSETEDKEFKKNYDQYINQVANKDDFKEEIVYFWAILEAANKLESSLVLAGSNHATGQITEENKFQPSNDTDTKDNQPSTYDTDKKKRDFYLHLNS